MTYLGALGSNLEKLLSYLQLVPSNFSYCKVWGKNKNTQIWDQKCLNWVFFGWNLKNNIVIFEINILEFV